MADMLIMTTGEFGDPVSNLILVKAGDFLFQEFNVETIGARPTTFARHRASHASGALPG